MIEQNESKDFVIDEKNISIDKIVAETGEIDYLQELIDHDFSSDEPTDFDKYYSVLESAERDNDEFKSNEAIYLIKELGPIYLDQEYLKELNKLQDNFTAFMKKHEVNSDVVKKMTEDDKNKVFAIGKFINKTLIQKINELKFTFALSIEEYKFIYSALRNKMSYDGTEVFNMVELKQKNLDVWEETYKALPKQAKEFYVTIDIRNVVMLYHFLSKHTVKGIDKEFYYFVEVLTKISETNKLFNAYNIIKDRFNSEYFVWSGSLTPLPEEGVPTVGTKVE